MTKKLEIVDSHFHIWDPRLQNLDWLSQHKKIHRCFTFDDLEKAYGKYDIDFKGAVYVEVDCENPLQEDELIHKLNHPKILAKVMRAQLTPYMRLPQGIAGVREPLHIDTSPRGRCLEDSFLGGLQVLADKNLVFECCNRVEELGELYHALKQVPELKAVINHVGNVKTLDATYQKNMRDLASLPNVYCKVSGYPTADKAFVHELLDFITDTFRPARLMYASNFPVLDLYSHMDEHFPLVRDYFSDDEAFFGKIAKKIYQINPVQRFASVIKLRPEKAAYYKQLHANPFDGVNRMIRDCGITKYHIFVRDNLLFSYMEYQGDDFEWDMAQMARDPLTQRWWQETDPCQMRIDGAAKDEWWAAMEEVYQLK